MPSYRSLIGHAPWRRFVLASTSARLPVTMGVFGMVLAGRSLGSFALGGRLAATYTLTGAATAIWRGRRLDRGELRRGLRRDGAAVAAVAAAMAVAVRTHAPWPVAALVAVALGASLAAIPGGYRSLLPAVVAESDVGAAYALDAVCVEMAFVLGPAVAAGAAWFTGASGVFVLMAACSLTGSIAAGRLPRVDRRTSGGAPAVAPHLVPGMVGVIIGAVAAGTALGTFDVTLPALAVALGSRAALGGVLITLTAVGSATSGLLLGPRIAASAHLARRATQLLGAFGLLAIPLALAPGLAGVALFALAAGAPFALMATAVGVIVQRSVDARRTSEAFSLLNAGLLAGNAAGSAVASWMLGPLGARGALLLASVGPLLTAAALLSVSRRRQRRGADAPAR